MKKAFFVISLLFYCISFHTYGAKETLSDQALLELLTPQQMPLATPTRSVPTDKNQGQYISYNPINVESFRSTTDMIIENALKSPNPNVKNNVVNDDLVVYTYRDSDKKTKTNVGAPPTITEGLYDPEPHNASTEITLLHGRWGQHFLVNPTIEAHFTVDADTSEMISSYQGKILLQESLNNEHSVLSGFFDSQNTMRTRVDIPLSKDNNLFLEVPLLDKENFYNFLDQEELPEYGGFLLIDMADESIHDVEIDAHYIQKLYLNDEMQKVNEGGPFRFVFFLCTDSGNITLTYRTGDGDADKTVHLQPDEIFFESPSAQKNQEKEFVIKEHTLLTGKYFPLELSGHKVRYFTSTTPSFVRALGTYRVDLPPSTRTSRQYLSIEQGRNRFFVGILDNRILIPDEKRFFAYLDYMNLDDMENICITQLNFTRTPIDVFVNSSSYGGPTEYMTFYMTDKGEMLDTFEDFTRTLFLVGHRRGVSRIKIHYDNNTVDYFQTYCNNSTYVMEQL